VVRVVRGERRGERGRVRRQQLKGIGLCMCSYAEDEGCIACSIMYLFAKPDGKHIQAAS